MGLKEWAEKNKAGGEVALANRAKLESQKAALRAHKDPSGLVLTSEQITYQGRTVSIIGAEAHVDSAVGAQSRVTATRVLAFGVFALAAKKQHGSVYLTVEHPDYQFVVPFPAQKEALAREFAARINIAGRR